MQGNPWLATGSARVILNEVNSTNPSLLNGYIEVAGQRAEVIIANPAGISCDGCGFINASRATLTTGTPLLDAGRISGYRVVDGVIQISGQGLDSRGVDFTDILARRITVDGAVNAERLMLIAGANDIDLKAESGVLPAVSSSAQAAANLASESLPEAERWGIDSTALGGMTAGQITLVATEAGVGVRHAGTMYAGVGEVRITANGDLVNAGSINGGAVALNASNRLQNSGKVYAEGDLAVQAQFIENSIKTDNSNAVLAARGSASLTAGGSVTSSGLLAAGLQADGTVQGGDLVVSAGEAITATGQNLSGNSQRWDAQSVSLAGSTTQAPSVTVTASAGDVDASGATLSATTLSLNSAQTLRTDGASVSAETLNLQAKILSNVGGSLIQTGDGDMALVATDKLDNTNGLIATNAANFSLNTQKFINQNGQLQHAGTGSFTLAAKLLDGQNGGGKVKRARACVLDLSRVRLALCI